MSIHTSRFQARTAFVNVRGIQAPKEVKIDGLRGWQYDVNSGDIFIKNCNTLQITNFTFSGAGKTGELAYEPTFCFGL